MIGLSLDSIIEMSHFLLVFQEITEINRLLFYPLCYVFLLFLDCGAQYLLYPIYYFPHRPLNPLFAAISVAPIYSDGAIFGIRYDMILELFSTPEYLARLSTIHLVVVRYL